MQSGQLFLVHVSWRSRDVIGDVAPGKFQVRSTMDESNGHFEASVPAYAREDGRDMQIAIRSEHSCFIVLPNGEQVPLTLYEHPDTGDQWWIEKGRWVPERATKGGFHDAPSFRHPGGSVDIRIGEETCRVHLYDPSISADEFQALLDDIKTWCWKMAIDESCYVTVGQESEVKVLSAEFLRFAEDFLRNVFGALSAPHCELRESVEHQRIDRLKPNGHSIRFLAQRGECDFVPGRGSVAHYDTAENRFLHGMLKAVLQMLRPQSALANESTSRFISTAKHYEDRVIELRAKTTETIDPRVLEENLRRSQVGRDVGFNKLKITNLPEARRDQYPASLRNGRWKDKKIRVRLPARNDYPEIYIFLESNDTAMIAGELNYTGPFDDGYGEYWRCDVISVKNVEHWRDYELECKTLEEQRRILELRNWEQPLPRDVIQQRMREADTLELRANALRSAANLTDDNRIIIQSLIEKACSADRALTDFGCKPDLRFAPTMVFLQSPAYSGALSSYRQIRDLTGLDDDGLTSLLTLEDVGLRDWPGVYERWCLVSLLKVLQDDFRFTFDKNEVRASLLKYCTGTRLGEFSAHAFRKDVDLELTLDYQPTFANGRRPDFLLEIKTKRDDEEVAIKCVLDAKACNFVNRPANARTNAWIYLDDCLMDLIGEKKDYSEAGENLVFIMHASQNSVTTPTTGQSWAKSSSYGGDAVYYWEVGGSSRIKKPKHKHGAVMVRPYDTTHLKRLVLMLIQFNLDVEDICSSCGSGGQDIDIRSQRTAGGNEKLLCECRKCHFISVKSLCAGCKNTIFKNQASWSYHDLHPVNPWNIKCWSCGTLL